ncbi:hypothetical protein C8R44DRAFT_850889 [Mycena epipterygia]|nr:hypothetical protein C8R44DRAFT_850889 [Mycena epipterygia]
MSSKLIRPTVHHTADIHTLLSTLYLSALAFLAVPSATPTDMAHAALTTSSDALPRLTKSSDTTFADVNKSLYTSEHKNSAIVRITYVSAKGFEGHPVTVAHDVLSDTSYPCCDTVVFLSVSFPFPLSVAAIYMFPVTHFTLSARSLRVR